MKRDYLKFFLFVILAQVTFKLFFDRIGIDVINDLNFMLLLTSTVLIFSYSYTLYRFNTNINIIPSKKKQLLIICLAILLLNLYISINLNNFNFLFISFAIILVLYLEAFIIRNDLMKLLIKPLVYSTLVFLLPLYQMIIGFNTLELKIIDLSIFKSLSYYCILFFLIIFIIGINNKISKLKDMKEEKSILNLLGETNIRRLCSIVILFCIIFITNIFKNYFREDVFSIIYLIVTIVLPLAAYAIFINNCSVSRSRSLSGFLFLSLFSMALSISVVFSIAI